ncbi:Similar to Alpha-ketoglutarate-dependent dioxygenase alkB homolog 2; acc. no. Q6NS38 [Pyronema omphalodes CBS 100304]|uniref:Similar to Alpha-ketoglutarate-dependent dioxygenase alkB homolog 2 acc. no. Q6NS38 n=1 Tax=Pyronema omphalodes (strain CBS 100304) TaxID=1076935 RepID=U4LW86_PYROM|nr:Similar to Alpha-ketoglutarate-dependent dioxygenase alkB homolog 2; acc. no. Q6NS38 [Pyronema omphalodes CBS 100304]
MRRLRALRDLKIARQLPLSVTAPYPHHPHIHFVAFVAFVDLVKLNIDKLVNRRYYHDDNHSPYSSAVLASLRLKQKQKPSRHHCEQRIQNTRTMQRALLILDLQNEFLSPSTGRCLLPNTTDDLTKQPAFLTNIRSLLSRFRTLGGDVIFMRSEYRDLREPSDETILIIHPSDEDDIASEASSDEGEGEGEGGVCGKKNSKIEASIPRPPKARVSSSTTKEISGTVLLTGRPPLLTDAYLSISTSHPPCSPGTPPAAWSPFVTPLIQPQDRTFTKSHYSAFRETPLLQTLRGRIVTQLVIVGLLTNVDVLATAADAARHGLEVWVVEDCLGYRSEAAHQEALEVMETELAVERCLSGVLVRGWEKERRRLQAAVAAGQKETKGGLGAAGMSQEDIRKLIEGALGGPMMGGGGAAAGDKGDLYDDYGEVDVPVRRAEMRSEGRERQRSEGSRENREQMREPRQEGGPMRRERVEAKVVVRRPRPDPKAADKKPVDGKKVEVKKPATNEAGVKKPASQPAVKSEAKKPEVKKAEPKKSETEQPATKKPESQPTLKPELKKPEVKEAEFKKSLEKQPETTNSEIKTIEKAEEEKVQLEEQETKTKSFETNESASKQPEATETKKPETAESAESPRPTSNSGTSKKERKPRKYESSAPVMGEGDSVGEGDSYIKYNILPLDQSSTAFENIKNEVQWRSMFHRGGEVPRLVAVEGEVREDGSFPIYRHPADESPPLLPFSPTINSIRLAVQKHLQHSLNHVLIQHYRDGNDYISEHSDKTLDIAKGSKIVNVSLGAQRTMILRQKKDTSPAASVAAEKQETRPMQRIPLPHNSIFCLGLETNQKWMHAIKADKREPKIKAPEELAYGGERISLTFRHIATYLSADEKQIYGQGAVAKVAEDMRETQNGPSDETEKLLAAFGAENQQSDFDWNLHYGKGFDVLNFQIPKPKLLVSSSLAPDISTARIKLCLSIKGVDFVEQVVEQGTTGLRTYDPRGTAPVFIDTDRDRTILTDSLAILQYLEMFYPAEPWLLPSPVEERGAYATALQRLQESEKLRMAWEAGDVDGVKRELRVWEIWLRRGCYAAGEELGLVDVALWPVLEAVERGGVELPAVVQGYWRRLRERQGVKEVHENKVETIAEVVGKKDEKKIEGKKVDVEVEELVKKVGEARIDS